MEDRRHRLSSATAARVLSIAAHPFVLAPITVALATRNWRLTAIIAATITLPMTVVIARKVRRGAWSDFDVSRQDQRSGLYWVGIPLLALAAFLAWWSGAPPSFLRGFVAVAAMFVVGLIGNRFLKISLHMMIAAYCSVILWRVYPWSAAVMVPLVVALAWSRRRLERHTPAEIAVGLAIGLAAGLYVVR